MGTATVKQVSFIDVLIRDREVPADALAIVSIRRTAVDFTSREASAMITKLQAYPRKRTEPKPDPNSSVSWADAGKALADLDISFYAIPAEYVSALQEIDLRGNDYLFVRVRNYQGRRYLSRAHGSVGTFRYSRFNRPRTVVALARIIAEDAYTFQRAFFEHTGRCGRCAAELTDTDSRARGFGPECWKVIQGR